MNGNKGVTKERLLAVFGLVVILVVIAAAVVGGLYWLTGRVSAAGLRWWAVGITLILPVAVALTWVLGNTAAWAHREGFDRGLDGAERTITSLGRGLAATASLARAEAQQARLTAQEAARQSWQIADNSDLLPPARILPPRQDGDVIEM